MKEINLDYTNIPSGTGIEAETSAWQHGSRSKTEAVLINNFER